MSQQPLPNYRKRLKACGFARADQVGSRVETIPFNRSHVEIEYEVAFFPPALLGAAVEDLETPVYDLEDIAGERPFTVGYMYGNDMRGSELTGQARRNLDRHGAVHEQAALVLHGAK
jgi:hypothetical protein